MKINYEEENIRYQKKKDSNISKANKKSDHKHKYDKIVLFEYQHSMTMASVWHTAVYYCSICGKIGNQVEGFVTWGWNKTKEEWLEKYPNAIFVKLERGKSWYDVSNINEVI
jgi:hypothetical protein